MILVSLAYRELNADSPDSGTTFTWVTKAFGPWVGWMGGWGLLAANIIVLSNLAGVAVDFFYLFLAQATGSPELADLASNKLLNVATCFVFVALAVWVSYRGPAHHQDRPVRPGGVPAAGSGPVRCHGLRQLVHVRDRHSLQLGLVRRHQDRDLRPDRRRHLVVDLRLLGLGRVPHRERGNRQRQEDRGHSPAPSQRSSSWASTCWSPSPP